jgi:beta-glucanase (GH16 family)
VPLTSRLLLIVLAGTVTLSPPAVGSPTTTSDAPVRAAAEVTSGVLHLRPAIAQQGKRPERSSSRTQALATFSVTRTGRTVVLQRDSGAGWETVARGREHRSGSTVFTLPDTTSLYRAVAESRSGSTVAVTDTVRGRSFPTLFRDEFSGRRVDRTKWEDQPTLAPAYMRMCSRLSRRARTIGGGVLRMGVTLDPARTGQTCSWALNGQSGSHPYMLNTQLYTRNTFDFTYGYAAVRMKMHLDKGMHASFWMQPANWYTPGDPSKGTEIDVVEYFGRTNRDSTIASFLHWYDRDGTHYKVGGKFPGANRLRKRAETWSQAYHVFSVERSADALVFRVDGREYWRQTELVSRAPQYLLLSMLTSDYELEKLTPRRMRQTAKVDWVRVWGP